MILRFFSTLLLSFVIFYNSTVFWSIIFTVLLLIFVIIFKAPLRKKLIITVLISGITITILQILFRHGKSENIIYHIGFIKIYKESLIISINVFFILLDMFFIIAILRTIDAEIIFSKIESYKLTKFLVIPLYAAYRFLPVITYHIKVMNFYAKHRIHKKRRTFKQTLKIYTELLIPLFVNIYKRIFFITLSAERKNYKNLKHYFERKKDNFEPLSFIFFLLTTIVIILYILFPKVMI